MLTIVGAGSVGLSLTARLSRAGQPVLLVTRSPEAARLIREGGLTLADPGSGEEFQVRPEVTCDPARDGERIGRGPLLFCVRTPDTDAAARGLAQAAPEAVAVSVQNDVVNEDRLSGHFETVLGAAYRQTCTRISPHAVRALGGGRIVIGLHPRGEGAEVPPLALALRTAGYDVSVSQRIGEDKWLKLVINLMSAPNALVRRDDHTSLAFVELKARLLEEAHAALTAAGIAARSCDGRDRSIEEEIAFQRAALERGESARRLPIYNQVWQCLAHGGPMEADAYHRTIADLAERSGLAAPLNRRMLAALLDARDNRRGPESVAADALLPAAELSLSPPPR